MKKRQPLFLQYIRHDLRCGLLPQWVKYLVALAPVGMLCLSVFSHWQFLCSQHEGVPAPTYGDYLFAMLKARGHMDCVGPFTLCINNMVIVIEGVDMFWPVPFIFLAFIVSFYPFKDLTGYGQQLLIRSRRRRTWWASKCLWVVACVTLHQAVMLLVPALFALCTGTMDFMPTVSLQEAFAAMDLRNFTLTDMVLSTIVFPWLVCITHSLLQMLVSLCTQPMMGMILITSMLAASQLIATPLLPGNYVITSRYGCSLLAPVPGLVFLAVVSITCVVIGGIVFQRKNIFSA